MKIGPGIQKLMKGDTQKRNFFQNKESRPKKDAEGSGRGLI
jgi:hypothetical protein